MLDIGEQLHLLVYRRGTSMRKVVKALKEAGVDIPCSSTVSTSIKNKRIRFETVQEILDYLGYKLEIKEK